MQTFGSFRHEPPLRSAMKGGRAAEAALNGEIYDGQKFLSSADTVIQFNKSMEVREFDCELTGIRTAKVTSNLKTRLAEGDLKERNKYIPPVYSSSKFASNSAKEKVFSLETLLVDRNLQERFAIPASMVAKMRSVAVEDAVRASEMLTSHIRAFDDYDRATVDPGNYGYTWKTARESLKQYASRFPVYALDAEALFCGDKLFIYSQDKRNPWKVCCNERVAWLGKLVHRVATATSPQEANFYLNKELCILDIFIAMGDEVLSPVVQFHAGPHTEMRPGKSIDSFPSLSVDMRLKLDRLSSNISLVKINDESCASAVRVSAKHVITCEHVVQEDHVMTIADRPVFERVALGDDLSVYHSEFKYLPWHLRTPKVGERVIIGYRRLGFIEFAGPFTIQTYSAESVSYNDSSAISPGMSGGAIIALKDMAFFGVHVGRSHGCAYGARFSADMSSKMWSMDEEISVVDSIQVNTRQPINLMRERGLMASCKLCVDSVFPVIFEGAQTSCALQVKPGLCAVPNNVRGKIFKDNAEILTIDHARDVGYRLIKVPTETTTVPSSFRDCVYGEHVMLIGKELEGEFVSISDIKVSQIYEGGSFQLSGIDYPNSSQLMGCAVVSILDGCVLGIITDTINDDAFRNSTAECSGINVEIDDELIDPMLNVATLFPNLNVTNWFGKACEEVSAFDSDSVSHVLSFSKELLQMSVVRKSIHLHDSSTLARLYLKKSRLARYEILGRAVKAFDSEFVLLQLADFWMIKADTEDEKYARLLMLLVYFIDKFEQSYKIVETLERLALI